MSTTTSSTAVLLANTGSPAEPNPSAVRRYLAQFLGDRRVVDYPRWLWLPVLHLVILNTRPRRSARLYQRIWSESGSPLISYSQRLADRLEAWLGERLTARVQVAVGMRYGEPAIGAVMRRLVEQGASRLVVLPLFPQYTSATSASIFDAVFGELESWRTLPELCTIQEYHTFPAHIAALAESIQASWQVRGRPQKLLFSFHGIPQAYIKKGETYQAQCCRTAELVSVRLGLSNGAWQVAFQSRFGPQEWLKPYTNDTLRDFGRAGLTSLDVVCPGFAVDCLETLDEIRHESRKIYEAAGGAGFTYIPALNDSPAHTQALGSLLLPYFR